MNEFEKDRSKSIAKKGVSLMTDGLPLNNTKYTYTQFVYISRGLKTKETLVGFSLNGK